LSTGEGIETFWSKFGGLSDKVPYMNQDAYVDTLSWCYLRKNIESRIKTLDLLVISSDRANDELTCAMSDLNKALLDHHELKKQFPSAADVVAMRSVYGLARAPTVLPQMSLEADLFGKKEELRANETLLAAMKGARSFRSGSSLAVEVAKMSRLIRFQRSEISAIEAANPSMMQPNLGHVIEYRHIKVRALKEQILELEALETILRSANERGRNHYLVTVKQKAANRVKEARIQTKIKSLKEELNGEESFLSVLPQKPPSERLDSLQLDIDMRIVKHVERCKRSIEELSYQLPLELKTYTESCQRDAETLLQGAEELTLHANNDLFTRSVHGAAVLLREHAKALLGNVNRASGTKLTPLPVLPVSTASELLARITEILDARTQDQALGIKNETARSIDRVSNLDCAYGCCGIKTQRCDMCSNGRSDSSFHVKINYVYVDSD